LYFFLKTHEHMYVRICKSNKKNREDKRGFWIEEIITAIFSPPEKEKLCALFFLFGFVVG
jgi:hypothetical protein